MNNFIQPGNVLEMTAPAGGVESGVPIQIGQLVGIPAVDAAEDERFSFQVVGVFRLPKATGQAWTEGQIVYFDATPGDFTTTAAGNLQAGTAVADAASGDTTGLVRLDGVARAQTAS